MPQDDGQEMQAAGHSRDRENASEGVPDLPYVRLTQRGRPPRRRPWGLLALVMAFHVLLAWVGWLLLGPTIEPEPGSGAISVTLFESTFGPPPPLLAPPPPLPGQPPPRRLHYEPPAKGAMQADLEGVKGPPVDLYQSNGQIRLPSASSARPAPVYTAPVPQGSKGLVIRNPIEYKPTPFNKAWAPPDQTLGDKTIGRAFDKAVEKTTVEKTVRLPGGIKLHCVLSPLVLVAGCPTEAPPPPPKNGDDIRLSMPPPETLTGKKGVVPSSASSTPASASTVPPAASSTALPAAATSTP